MTKKELQEHIEELEEAIIHNIDTIRRLRGERDALQAELETFLVVTGHV